MSRAVRDYAVYRIFDADDRLLYVGVNFADPHNRVKAHRRGKAVWAPRIHHATYVWFSTRLDALIEERRLTLQEAPEFPTTVTGRTARTLATAYLAADFRRIAKWGRFELRSDYRDVAKAMLAASGYSDDSCVTPSEEPQPNEDRFKASMDRTREVLVQVGDLLTGKSA